MNKETYFKQRIEEIKQELLPLQKTSSIYSTLRLCSVVLPVVLAIYADQSNTSFGFVLAFVCIAFFLVLVKKHQAIKISIQLLQAKKEVLEQLLARFDDTWKQTKNKQYEEETNTVSIDLDLLGSQSLYQYLSMCATPFGKQQLSAWLLGEEDGEESIKKRQEAIKTLLKNEEILLDIQTSSHLFLQDQRKIKEADFQFLLDYAKDNRPLLPSFMYIIALIMSVYTLVTLCLGLLKIIPLGYSAVGMLLNICIGFALFAKAGKELEFTKNLGQIMNDYERIFSTTVAANFNDSYLNQQQAILKKGLKGIHKMRNVMGYLSLRHNFIAYLLLATLCQLDVFCLHALQSWRNRYGIELEEWLISAGCMEALASLCVIGQVKKVCCFPEIMPQTSMRLELTNGYHPLISQGKAVSNSFASGSDTIVVTGSNMSGKTTFLRTLGINMMLLRAGAQVCASSMHASILDVHTSMRLKDDVNEGISTFYAELLRIRHMMDASKEKKPMLVLIDEIFKGTNSADRILCAKTAIKNLHHPWIITLVSTHDFELCDLDKEEAIMAKNYHFSETYVDDEIQFDYTLKPDRCKTTNALQLMKMAGISDA